MYWSEDKRRDSGILEGDRKKGWGGSREEANQGTASGKGEKGIGCCGRGKKEESGRETETASWLDKIAADERRARAMHSGRVISPSGHGLARLVIYGLRRSDSEEIFYIGKSRGPEQRLATHRARFGQDIEIIELDDSLSEMQWIDLLKPSANITGTEKEFEWHRERHHFDGKETVIVSARVLPEEQEAIQEFAKHKGLSIAQWTREAVVAHMDQCGLPVGCRKVVLEKPPKPSSRYAPSLRSVKPTSKRRPR